MLCFQRLQCSQPSKYLMTIERPPFLSSYQFTEMQPNLAYKRSSLGCKLPQQGPYHQLAGSMHPCLEKEVLLVSIDRRQLDTHLVCYLLVLLPTEDERNDLSLPEGETAGWLIFATIWFSCNQRSNRVPKALDSDALFHYLARSAVHHPEYWKLGDGGKYQQRDILIGKHHPLQGEQGGKVLCPTYQDLTIIYPVCR